MSQLLDGRDCSHLGPNWRKAANNLNVPKTPLQPIETIDEGNRLSNGDSTSNIYTFDERPKESPLWRSVVASLAIPLILESKNFPQYSGWLGYWTFPPQSSAPSLVLYNSLLICTDSFVLLCRSAA